MVRNSTILFYYFLSQSMQDMIVVNMADYKLAKGKGISPRNLEAVRRKLAECQIPVLAMEVEDDFPRTVVFEPESGILQIKTIGKTDRFI